MRLERRDLTFDVLEVISYSEIKLARIVYALLRCLLPIFPVQWVNDIDLKNDSEESLISGKKNLFNDSRAEIFLTRRSIFFYHYAQDGMLTNKLVELLRHFHAKP